MNTPIRLSVAILAVAASTSLVVYATDPVPPANTGHVLILDNDRIIEGQIEREGDQYRIRRTVGETRVPAANVVQLCESIEEAYDFLRARSNLRDADEHLRLARWCHLHGLARQALAEANAALDLKPHSAECQRLQQNLQRAATAPPPATPKPKNPIEAGILPPVEVNAESMAQFATRVQPILMNTCASCHVPNRGGSFKLTRAIEDGMVSRRATQQNLAAVLGQINWDRWEASPFLTKSVSVHGEASQPPIKSRQVAPYRALEDWIRTTLAKNPHLSKERIASAYPEPTKASPEAKPVRKEATFAETAAATPASAPATRAAKTGPPMPVDPFDPVSFNQATGSKP
jgi:hypothetical protein